MHSSIVPCQKTTLAVAVVSALAALSCEEIRTMENSEPPACEEYRRKAEAAYGQ